MGEELVKRVGEMKGEFFFWEGGGGRSEGAAAFRAAEVYSGMGRATLGPVLGVGLLLFM
jgi:hypothetical protein